MVEIKGQDKTKKKKVTCENCAAKLEYLPIAVKEVNGRDYSGGPDGNKHIVCPGCGKKVILERW